MLDSVVLPAPFSPSSACTSPAAASKSTSSLATTAGNRFVIPRSATAGGGGEARASPPGLSALGAPDHPVFDGPVVEAALPTVVHRGLDAPEVVGPPVVDRRGQPLLRSERLR